MPFMQWAIQREVDQTSTFYIARSLTYFVEQMKLITKSNSVLNFGAFPYRHDEIMDSFADISELNKIGWSAKFSISEGITNIFKFYAEESNK